MQYYCFFDGGCHNNGKQYARAYGSYLVFKVPDTIGKPNSIDPAYWDGLIPVIAERKFKLNYSGKCSTNNMAEAEALLNLISNLYSSKILNDKNRITIYGDSKLVVFQIQGIYRTKNQNLLGIYNRARQIFKSYRNKYCRAPGDLLTIDLISGDLMKQIIGH